MPFNERLRSVRIDRGLTQQQVSDELGVTKATYSGYETGRREPDVKKIKLLAKILKTTGDHLLGTEKYLRQDLEQKEPPIPTLADTGDPELNELHKELLNLILSTPPSKLQEGINYLRYLSSEKNQ